MKGPLLFYLTIVAQAPHIGPFGYIHAYTKRPLMNSCWTACWCIFYSGADRTALILMIFSTTESMDLHCPLMEHRGQVCWTITQEQGTEAVSMR
ncbi:hypothetical protein B0H34DRAFT_332956 [Crassisporium funariophilum]|nr:hypothetical protein B0H34DRAFT_332956 [Crassisporium funariophilum]